MSKSGHAKVVAVSLGSEARESTRPIRALHRGLEVLAQLNLLQHAAINTVASAAKLPRTTTFRILETLRASGYVHRDSDDDCYRPTVMVRSLSDGFSDDAMIGHLAKPHLAALGARLRWPVAVATPSGAAMLYSTGARVPMLASAAGRAYLAFCTAPERDALLELMSRSSLPEDRLARSRGDVDRLLNETRSQGFGMAHGARRAGDDTSLAVTVRARNRIIAAITVQYPAGAMSLHSAIDDYLPKLREIALKIEAAFA